MNTPMNPIPEVPSVNPVVQTPGYTQPSSPTPAYTQPVAPMSNFVQPVTPKRNDTKFYVVLVIIVIIIIALVGFIIYALTQLNTQSPTANNTQNTNQSTKAETTPDYFTNFVKINNAIEEPTNTTSTAGRISLGLTGTGDSKGTSHPTVLKVGNTYKMWYTGDDDNGIARIYYAESDDLMTWTKYDNSVPTNSDTTSTNGRIPVGTAGRADSKSVANPSVLYKDGEYKMWYCGYDTINRVVLYATSKDGLTWTKYDNTIPTVSNTTSTKGRVGNGTSGRFDAIDACSPEVIWDEEDSIYKMWYSSVDPGYIGMATSPDGLTWTKIDNTIPAKTNTTSTNGRLGNGLSGARDSKYLRNPAVVKLNGKYHMWYVSAPETGMQSISYATSTDGLSWTKYNNGMLDYETFSNGLNINGYLYRGTEGTLDFNGFGATDMLYENGKMYMFIFGTGPGRIETAVSTDLTY